MWNVAAEDLGAMHLVPPVYAPLAVLEWTGLASEADILGSSLTNFDLRLRHITLSRSTPHSMEVERGTFSEDGICTDMLTPAEHCVCCPLHSAAISHCALSSHVHHSNSYDMHLWYMIEMYR